MFMCNFNTYTYYTCRNQQQNFLYMCGFMCIFLVYDVHACIYTCVCVYSICALVYVRTYDYVYVYVHMQFIFSTLTHVNIDMHHCSHNLPVVTAIPLAVAHAASFVITYTIQGVFPSSSSLLLRFIYVANDVTKRKTYCKLKTHILYAIHLGLPWLNCALVSKKKRRLYVLPLSLPCPILDLHCSV